MPSPTVLSRAVTKYARLMGLADPWRLGIRYLSPIDDEDAACYASCEPQPQYYRATLSFDPHHAAWQHKEHGEVGAAVRHELAHALLSPLAQFTTQLIDAYAGGNGLLKRQLDDIEDGVVTRIERMPVWGR